VKIRFSNIPKNLRSIGFELGALGLAAAAPLDLQQQVQHSLALRFSSTAW
jgi:hypothetical protein